MRRGYTETHKHDEDHQAKEPHQGLCKVSWQKFFPVHFSIVLVDSKLPY